jgi:FkbM family methyltransferase
MKKVLQTRIGRIMTTAFTIDEMVNEYQLQQCKSAGIIIDLGANDGSFVLTAHSLFPSAAIHAYEPDPANYQRLLKNVPNTVVCLPFAVAHRFGDVQFSTGRDVDSHICWGQHKAAEIECVAIANIPAVTLEWVIAPFNKVDILKC